MFILITILISAQHSRALWFLIELIRYLASGEYEMDQRLQAITRKDGSS